MLWFIDGALNIAMLTPCRSDETQEEVAAETGPITAGAVSVLPFQTHTPEEMTRLQMEDPIVGPVYQAVENGKLPSHDELSILGRESKLLLQQWECLLIKDDMLWRKQLEGRDVLQLIVPYSLHPTVLKDIHEGAAGGHLRC